MSQKNLSIILAIIIAAAAVSAGLFFVLKKPPINTSLEIQNQPAVQPRPDHGRYFLSKIALIKKIYQPTILSCFFDEKKNEIYQQWAGIYYPSSPPYEVALIRVELNATTSLDNSCYIKEIKTREDWNEVKSKYDFSKDKFGF